MDLTTFSEKYLKLRTHAPIRDDGTSNFTLTSAQRVVINHISLFDKLGVVHDRQVGFSSIIACYIAHWLIYNESEKNELLLMNNKLMSSSTILNTVWDILKEANAVFNGRGQHTIVCGENVFSAISSIELHLNSRTYAVIIDNATHISDKFLERVFFRLKIINKLIIGGCYTNGTFIHDYMYNKKFDKLFKLQMVDPRDSTMPEFPVHREKFDEVLNFNIKIPLDLLARLQEKLDNEDLTLIEYLESIV